MQKINQKYIVSIVKKALYEDLNPLGDITTKLLTFKNKKSKAKIIARQNGIVAGLDFCKTTFKLIGKETVFRSKVKDGSIVKKNRVIAEIKANTKTILVAERTALNFLNHASGIATLTYQFVKKVNKKTKICCTRKTTPNLRLLEKYAVRKGGGHNHRYNLSDEILIKDNHISSENNLLGYLFITKDITSSLGYSSQVFDIVVALRLDGKLAGAKVIDHLEPIIGMYTPDGELVMPLFTAQYKDLDIRLPIKINLLSINCIN